MTEIFSILGDLVEFFTYWIPKFQIIDPNQKVIYFETINNWLVLGIFILWVNLGLLFMKIATKKEYSFHKGLFWVLYYFVLLIIGVFTPKVDGEIKIKDNGFLMYWPISTKIYTINIAKESLDLENIAINTKDNNTVVISGKLFYRINPELVNKGELKGIVEEYNNFRYYIADKTIIKIKSNLMQRNITEITNNIDLIEKEILEKLKNILKEDMIEVIDFGFSDISKGNTLKHQGLSFIISH